MNLIYDRTAEDVEESKRITEKLIMGISLTEAEQTSYDTGLRPLQRIRHEPCRNGGHRIVSGT